MNCRICGQPLRKIVWPEQRQVRKSDGAVRLTAARTDVDCVNKSCAAYSVTRDILIYPTVDLSQYANVDKAVSCE